MMSKDWHGLRSTPPTSGKYASIDDDDVFVGYDQMPPKTAEAAKTCDDDLEEIIKWGAAQSAGDEVVLSSCFRKAWLAGANYVIKQTKLAG